MAEVRVLIVDDQEPFRRAMAAVVEETDGFVVVGSATTGEESLAAAAELRPDLVLMDVNLPGIDGIEATRRLVAEPDAPGGRPAVDLRRGPGRRSPGAGRRPTSPRRRSARTGSQPPGTRPPGSPARAESGPAADRDRDGQHQQPVASAQRARRPPRPGP